MLPFYYFVASTFALSDYNNTCFLNSNIYWEVLKVFDSEAAVWVSGKAETIDYFG